MLDIGANSATIGSVECADVDHPHTTRTAPLRTTAIPANLVGAPRIGHGHGRFKERMISSSPSGLIQLFGELRGELLRFLTARTGDHVEAEDLVQELWIRIQTVDPGPIGNGRAYLYRVAQNLVLDRARERRRRERRDGEWADSQTIRIAGEAADSRASAPDAIIEREDAAALATAIAALPEGAGRAFRLHKLDGLSHAEVAARLGISRSGVEKHIAVAMTHLRRALKD